MQGCACNLKQCCLTRCDASLIAHAERYAILHSATHPRVWLPPPPLLLLLCNPGCCNR
jgi:hypothetical protein